MTFESACKTPWSASEHELRQVLKLNKKLAWFPRFRIRNLITPRFLQVLMRAGQLGDAGKPTRHGLTIETKTIVNGGAQVQVRIIRPRGKAKGVVLDYHGGGWVIGNPQMNDDLNIAMVKACQVTVVSVDYRLAVSTPVAGILEDCLCAARWLLDAQHAEFAGLPVVLVGESAGGHLAAATLLALKELPSLLQRVSGALLYYGVYDLTGTPSVRSATSSTLVLDGPGLVNAFRMLTPGLSDQQRRQPLLSPLYGDFTGLPPALMIVGELDPLMDDTFGLAEQWVKAAPVEAHLLPACPHGFIHFPTDLAARVLGYSHGWITARLEGWVG